MKNVHMQALHCKI